MSAPESAPVVVVTGATAGVGRAVARRFARQGARLGLLARGPDALDATLREVVDLGGQAVAVPTDVADPDQVEAAAQQVEETFGAPDVWVNNAMTAVLAEVRHTTPAEFRRVTEVVYLGFVHGTLCALSRMQPRDKGVIVQVGSALAHRGIPLQASYCAAKHAIDGFNESLRSELLHQKSAVRVTSVNLPGLNTPQFGWARNKLDRHSRPVPPIYQPEVAARAIVWSAEHPGRARINVGYPTPLTIWGNRLAPGLIDRYLAATNYEAQLTDLPLDDNRSDYLFDPVPGDAGAHGIFDADAKARSLQLEASLLRRPLLAGGGLALMVGGAIYRATRR